MGDANDATVLGLEPRVVRLHEHSPRWATLFREEALRLRAALGEQLIAIEHIGSTAIPGIKAKPILDMLAGVVLLAAAPAWATPLAALGYDYAANAGVPGTHVFGKGLARTHLLHVVEYNGPVWRDHLAFRDALRRDPARAQAYESLKCELARQFPNDRAAYTAAKASFIRQVVAAFMHR